MAVRADELALRDLGKDSSTAVAAKVAHVVDSLATGQVIPTHRGVMKEAAAVSARHARLEVVMPLNRFAPSFALPCHETRTLRAEVVRIVSLAAGFAPCLMTVTSAMELLNGLLHATAGTSLHL